MASSFIFDSNFYSVFDVKGRQRESNYHQIRVHLAVFRSWGRKANCPSKILAQQVFTFTVQIVVIWSALLASILILPSAVPVSDINVITKLIKAN